MTREYYIIHSLMNIAYDLIAYQLQQHACIIILFMKGGSLMLTAATVGVGSAGGVIAGGSESSPTRSIVGASVVAIVEVERGELSVHQRSRSQGHQCCRFATNGC